MLDWNDLRYFLSVAREGSTLAAAKALRVSQTTVARRIAALEAAIGFPLFEKRQAGYALTPAGQDLIQRAEQVEHDTMDPAYMARMVKELPKGELLATNGGHLAMYDDQQTYFAGLTKFLQKFK